MMIDSSDLEVAAGLVRNARVFYHHGQAWKGAESSHLSFSPTCLFTGQVQGAGVVTGPFRFSCTKFGPEDYAFSCSLHLAEGAGVDRLLGLCCIRALS